VTTSICATFVHNSFFDVRFAISEINIETW